MTSGNPFFVSQILAQPDSPLPGSVRDAVLARMAALAPPERHEAIRDALGRPREVPFAADRLGSRIIFISDRY